MRRASTGRSPTVRRPAEQPRPRGAGQDRAVERRRGELRDPVGGAADEEHVGARRLREVAVDGQEQGVVRAGPAGLEPGVDVVGAGRRLERGERILRVAPDRGWRRGAGRPPGGRPAPRSTGQAWIDERGRDRLVRRQHAARRDTAPRVTVIRMDASPSGPSRPSAASSAAMPAAEARVRRPSGSSMSSPSAERRSRARCSASSVGRPAARAERLEHAVAELEAAVEDRQVRRVGRQELAVDPDVPRRRVIALTRPPRPPMAPSGPRALATVSSHSAAGSLRQVMPPPTWRVRRRRRRRRCG